MMAGFQRRAHEAVTNTAPTFIDPRSMSRPLHGSGPAFREAGGRQLPGRQHCEGLGTAAAGSPRSACPSERLAGLRDRNGCIRHSPAGPRLSFSGFDASSPPTSGSRRLVRGCPADIALDGEQDLAALAMIGWPRLRALRRIRLIALEVTGPRNAAFALPTALPARPSPGSDEKSFAGTWATRLRRKCRARLSLRPLRRHHADCAARRTSPPATSRNTSGAIPIACA